MALFNSPSRRKPGFRLALFASVFCILVIGLGAFTRLVDAGLGCPDWPGCYGHLLWPIQEHNVERANEAWPDMPVDHSKTWPEMVHRYLATALGLLAIGLVALAWRHRHIPGQPFRLALFILAFVILQGLFGKWTVTLKLWPQVVTIHLLGGFTTLCLFWLMTLRLNNQRWQLGHAALGRVQSLRPWAIGALLVVVAQIALGGWTTSNYAAVACPDLPTCQGQWLPPMDFRQGFDVFQEVGPNYLGGTMDNEARVAIHFAHRVGAIITALYIAFLCFWLVRRGATSGTRLMAWVIGGITTLQILLGLGNIVLHFPIWVAVAHNGVGAVLLAAVVTLLHRLYTAEPSPAGVGS